MHIRTAVNRYLMLSVGVTAVVALPACNNNGSAAPLVKVFKSDGSLQCESDGVSLEAMALELTAAGIDVICVQKGHDGLSRATVCGLETGNLNIYQIHRTTLQDAAALGFESVQVLPEFQDQSCTRSEQ